jgi:ubiquinone/menaquinone biosynthesis C-methylase UbiE
MFFLDFERPLFQPESEITAIDLSQGMLEVVHQKGLESDFTDTTDASGG